jgi:S-adenosylmethionine:tRNA ribosyltransferase-isomerase
MRRLNCRGPTTIVRSMRTDELNFHLPPELIAQTPASERTSSRLLHYRRAYRSIAHRAFSELPRLLRRGDVLVFNDTRVLPARFMLRKLTGGRVEGLFLGQSPDGTWNVLLKNLGRVRAEQAMHFANAPEILARVIVGLDEGQYQLRVETTEPALRLLTRVGRMPLPPYIRREHDRDARDDYDRERYQTIYARVAGSVAAPTAGLHFTESLLSQLDAAGIERTFITLHVGLGTFKPVSADRLEDHVMHTESYSISAQTADRLNRAKQDRSRIVAVGTTCARVLESQPEDRPFGAIDSQTSIFIHPPYQWKHVSALITNFHLPRSTLIALVAALTGIEEQRRIYREAIEHRYRFFSYGDAMLIE